VSRGLLGLAANPDLLVRTVSLAVRVPRGNKGTGACREMEETPGPRAALGLLEAGVTLGLLVPWDNREELVPLETPEYKVRLQDQDHRDLQDQLVRKVSQDLTVHLAPRVQQVPRDRWGPVVPRVSLEHPVIQVLMVRTVSRGSREMPGHQVSLGHQGTPGPQESTVRQAPAGLQERLAGRGALEPRDLVVRMGLRARQGPWVCLEPLVHLDKTELREEPGPQVQ